VLALSDLEVELGGVVLGGVVELGGIEVGVVELVVGDGDDTVETGGDEETTERKLAWQYTWMEKEDQKW